MFNGRTTTIHVWQLISPSCHLWYAWPDDEPFRLTVWWHGHCNSTNENSRSIFWL